MTLLIGIVAASALFSLFAFMATRSGTRLEGGGSCQGSIDSPEACLAIGECELCGHFESGSGWWARDGVKDGDQR